MRQPLASLSPRDRRAVVIGFVAIGSLVIVGRVVPAWREWKQSAVASAAEAARAAARDEVLARSARAIHDSLAARSARLASLAPTWLTGDSPASAGAGLAALVTRAATGAALTLGTVDIRTDSVGHNLFVPVHVRLSVIGDIQGVATLLAALDRGPVTMRVVSLAIQGGDPAAPPQHPEILHVDLAVDALWRPNLVMSTR